MQFKLKTMGSSFYTVQQLAIQASRLPCVLLEVIWFYTAKTSMDPSLQKVDSSSTILFFISSVMLPKVSIKRWFAHEASLPFILSIFLGILKVNSAWLKTLSSRCFSKHVKKEIWKKPYWICFVVIWFWIYISYSPLFPAWTYDKNKY